MIKRLRRMTLSVMLVSVAFAQAQTYTTLHNFTGSPDGSSPYAGLIQDAAGNLYGTTQYGGNSYDDGCGVVYEVGTTGTETVLYAFCSQEDATDGAYPYAPAVRDASGILYGTTTEGGSELGQGVVFKLDTAGNETVLHDFPFDGWEGGSPEQGLAIDEAGNLFGTTKGSYENDGAIFRVDSAGNFAVLHSFAGWPSDGAIPQFGHQIMDKSGNLYGLTSWGGKTQCGSYGCGALYKLKRNKTTMLLHTFNFVDGCYPYGSVIRDKAGNFYGTTSGCGSNNYGTVWKASKQGKAAVLHNFAGGESDGCTPYAGVAQDSNGNVYGATSGCGAYGYGILFEVSSQGTFTLLHSFAGYPSDGANPYGDVLWNANGELFGTTYKGGSSDRGTVWSYVP